jgi:hypothetical protein
LATINPERHDDDPDPVDFDDDDENDDTPVKHLNALS